MKIRTGAVVLVVGFGLLSVLQQGTLAQSSCSSPSDCNDGNSCTDDACDSGAGVCVHSDNGSCTANPKTLGYWRKVCRGGGNTGEYLTGADVNCVGTGSNCPYYAPPVYTVEDLCAALDLSNSNGQDPDCNRGYEQVIALQLNICRGRLTLTQEVDIECCGCGGSFTSDVRYALALAGNTVCADSFPTHCSSYVCVPKAINQGRALHVSGLVVSRLSSGGLHLAWTPPLADMEALTTTPHSYRVWRASGSDATFVQIAEVSDPSFDDATAEGDYLRYDVTPVW